jgi:hypothetical protein
VLVASSFLLIAHYNSPVPVSVKKWSLTGAHSEALHSSSLYKHVLLTSLANLLSYWELPDNFLMKIAVPFHMSHSRNICNAVSV